MAEIQTMLEACEEAVDVPTQRGGPGFSQWEQEFLASVREQYDQRGSLSERQEEILTKLYDRT